MKAYVYQAALLCEDCGIKQRKNLDAAFAENGAAPGTDRDDSDRYPQGPHGSGGGEADAPQHCDHCHAFLENPLTLDGSRYVEEMLEQHAEGERGSADVLRQWAEFYGLEYRAPAMGA